MYSAFSGASIPMIQWPSVIASTAKKGVVSGLVLKVASSAARRLPLISREAPQAAMNCSPGSGRKPISEPAKTPRATRCGWSGSRRIR